MLRVGEKVTKGGEARCCCIRVGLEVEVSANSPHRPSEDRNTHCPDESIHRIDCTFNGLHDLFRVITGQKLVIEPSPPKSLLKVLATLQPLEEDFPPILDLPLDPVEF